VLLTAPDVPALGSIWPYVLIFSMAVAGGWGLLARDADEAGVLLPAVGIGEQRSEPHVLLEEPGLRRKGLLLQRGPRLLREHLGLRRDQLG
jgi:hypothetical protein